MKTKKELKFYIQADRMMNRGVFTYSLKHRIKNMIIHDDIMSYLYVMRKLSYYKRRKGIFNLFCSTYYFFRYRKLGMKLGFSIGYNVFGYGLVLPHHGTIVVGNSNRVGNYAVLQTSSCISDNSKIIGDALYVSTGVKITSQLTLGDNVSICANSVVNKSFLKNNILLAGMPAIIKKEIEPWYVRDGFDERVRKIENMKTFN